jgi:alkylation response protein AidB-like acyl-CoA dehydrogenase
MVDMFMEFEEAISMTYMATLALETSSAERTRSISAAKVDVGKACRFVGQNAVQLHGAIGTTDELALSHYFRRATVLENMFGSVDHHLTRFASTMSAASAPNEEVA